MPTMSEDDFDLAEYERWMNEQYPPSKAPKNIRTLAANAGIAADDPELLAFLADPEGESEEISLGYTTGEPIENYDPSQPRNKDGEFARGGAGSVDMAKRVADPNRVARAKAAAVRVASDVQRYSEEHNEPVLAKHVKGISLKDNEPVDVVTTLNGKHHGIELKTMTVGAGRKITMSKSAMARKRKWAKKNKGTVHTVVFDDTKVFNAFGPGKHDYSQRQIYYRRGYGSFRVDGMHKVANVGELKKLLNTPTKQLTVAAGGNK